MFNITLQAVFCVSIFLPLAWSTVRCGTSRQFDKRDKQERTC